MNAVMRFVLWGAIPLGALLGGVLATTIGLRATLFVSGVGVALSWLPVFFSPVRTLRSVPERAPLEPADRGGLATVAVDA
jgi:predicted MFS family arabinose efflux permease